MTWVEKFLSRKLVLIVFAMVLVTFVGLVAAKLAAVEAIYMTFVGAIVSLAGIYAGANVSHHWVNGKQNTTVGGTPDEEDKEEKDEGKKEEGAVAP